MDDLAAALRPLPDQVARIATTMEMLVEESRMMRGEMAEMRTEFREEMARSRDEFRADMARSRDEFREDMARSRDEFREDMGRSRDELREDMAQSRGELTAFRSEMAGAHRDLQRQIAQIGWTLAIALIASLIALMVALA